MAMINRNSEVTTNPLSKDRPVSVSVPPFASLFSVSTASLLAERSMSNANIIGDDVKITDEMKIFFDKRTQEHIDRVVNNMLLMEGYKNLDIKTLQERGKIHDLSKLSEPELEGYIWLTWWHACKTKKIAFDYPKGKNELVDKAISHHLKNNLHHAESHSDVNKMTDLDVVEMVCDWTAMSQEFNQASCQSYVKNNIAKWKFSDEKIEEIFA